MIVQAEAPSSVELLSRRQRIFATTRGLILQWRDRPHLMFEIYTFGAPPTYCTLDSSREQNFTRMLKYFQARQDAQVDQGSVPSINQGLTDADYGEIYEAVCAYIKTVAERGKWRRRKDSRG